MIVKNPYDNTNDLDKIDREYLKAILWEINKFRLPDIDSNIRAKDYSDDILNLNTVKEAINNDKYFEIPLKRGGTFSRLHGSFNGDATSWVKGVYKTII
jgi:hypothetical protein